MRALTNVKLDLAGICVQAAEVAVHTRFNATGHPRSRRVLDRRATEERLEQVAAQVELLREVVGNPFRPATVEPAWRTWMFGTVPKLAATIYEDRKYKNLPILADALEEAGGATAEMLNHCRSGGDHVRGCGVVDLLLGKA